MPRRQPHPPLPDTPVHELFAEQVRRAPDALAVTWRDEKLSYAQVDEHADLLARRLYANGVRPGHRVGLRTLRTPELVIGALAILKAGASYVPLEEKNPPERTEFLLEDAQATAIVTDLPVDFRFTGPVLRTTNEVAKPLPEAKNDEAYVCYTSGTTGRPKGVRVSHRNVVRLVRNTGYVHFGPETRVLPSGSIAFDAMTFELWGPLLNGGSVHLVDNDVVLSARALKAEIRDQHVTTMWLTSPLFNQLVEQDPATFEHLEELIVGGDALSPKHIGKAMDACATLQIVNGYGPTENTTFSLTHRLTKNDLTRIPIGTPIAHSTAYVLDEQGNPCPAGVPGELFLGGDGVALGYLSWPELTAEKFVPDPFRPGHRMYRSGDLAQRREDGVIDFLGRRDQQVKVRGFRVEPGEIENAMLDHPGVREAVVVARNRATDKYLCGYYTGSTEGLREHLARTLPDHMVPSYLVELPALPLNHSGKIDRNRLPAPDIRTDEHGEPRDEVERTLTELAAHALGVTGVGITHDLRDLGADSLTATLLAAGIGARLDRWIPVSAVLRHSRLDQLARLVRDTTPGGATSIPTAPDLPEYPLTHQQRQIYFEQLKDTTAVHYNVPARLDLPEEIDTGKLTQALTALATRHDALRTRFTLDARQVVEPEIAIELTKGAKDFVRPFDLTKAPLWRVDVSGTTLRLDLHHIITDGFSLHTLLTELSALYRGEELPTPTRFRDYAVWHQKDDSQKTFWHNVFKSPPQTKDLPTDTERPEIRSLDGDIVEFAIPADPLRRLARNHDVTLFAFLAAAHAIVLSDITGAHEVVQGTPVSGRMKPGTHDVVGMLANTVCLRATITPDKKFADFLTELAHTAEEAFAHQDFPFEDVVALTKAPRDYRRTPLFDALIALHSSRYLYVDWAGTRVPLRFDRTGQSVFDLDMQIYDRDQELQIAWRYGSHVLRRSTVESWAQRFRDVLDAVLAEPATTLRDLSHQDLANADTAPAFDFDL